MMTTFKCPLIVRSLHRAASIFMQCSRVGWVNQRPTELSCWWLTVALSRYSSIISTLRRSWSPKRMSRYVQSLRCIWMNMAHEPSFQNLSWNFMCQLCFEWICEPVPDPSMWAKAIHTHMWWNRFQAFSPTSSNKFMSYRMFSLKLLGSLQVSLSTYSLMQKLCYKKYILVPPYIQCMRWMCFHEMHVYALKYYIIHSQRLLGT